MINKQNLWFITLFSLILVLGIYYVSMGDETVKVLAGNNDVSEVLEVKESDVIDISYKIKEGIHEIDESAFFVVCDAYEVFGGE